MPPLASGNVTWHGTIPLDAPGVGGTFANASGKLSAVPILLSDAQGTWRVVDGDLTIEGATTVSDAQDPPRFWPLRSDDFRLTLVDNRIDATAWLLDPETGTRVTDVTIEHSLETGIGNAVLDVPGITFEVGGYQPDELTRLTTGVVALVDGTLTGKGRINWSPEGTTSTGTFSTADMDLAAPFGPVEGLTTTVNFTDLLALESAPGQVAEVDLIQTGIDVVDGTIRYQLLRDLKVRVESGHWPFAGGDLFLEETVLDFSKPTTKILTFRVVGLDAATFVEQMDFTVIEATGTFDGVIPMEFDQSGGRIIGEVCHFVDFVQFVEDRPAEIGTEREEQHGRAGANRGKPWIARGRRGASAETQEGDRRGCGRIRADRSGTRSRPARAPALLTKISSRPQRSITA